MGVTIQNFENKVAPFMAHGVHVVTTSWLWFCYRYGSFWLQ